MAMQGNFLWGVVNIAQQTESGDANSDWTLWARRALVPHIGTANAYEQRYAEDHTIAQSFGCTALRVSIAWSRVEPEEGVFNDAAVAHYRALLLDIRARGMQTVVGLWHWSVPAWCAPVHHRAFVDQYVRFLHKICTTCGDVIDIVVPLNEPNVFLHMGYISGERPPFLTSRLRAVRAAYHLHVMHRKTYAVWKARYPATPIGSTFLWNDEQPAHRTIAQKLFLRAKRCMTTAWMVRSLARSSDFIGINYYTSDTFYFGYSGGRWGVHGTNDWHSPDVWRTFAKGLYRVLMEVQRFGKPVMILENGKPTHNVVHDTDRQVMLAEIFAWMRKAISDGADVQGYFHYSLCDGYEWTSGYDFHFGMVGVHRATQERILRDSGRLYKRLIARYGTVLQCNDVQSP